MAIAPADEIAESREATNESRALAAKRLEAALNTTNQPAVPRLSLAFKRTPLSSPTMLGRERPWSAQTRTDRARRHSADDVLPRAAASLPRAAGSAREYARLTGSVGTMRTQSARRLDMSHTAMAITYSRQASALEMEVPPEEVSALTAAQVYAARAAADEEARKQAAAEEAANRIVRQRPVRQCDMLVLRGTQTQLLRSADACAKALREEPRLSAPQLAGELMEMIQPVVAALERQVALMGEEELQQEQGKKRSFRDEDDEDDSDDEAPPRKRGSFREEDDEEDEDEDEAAAATQAAAAEAPRSPPPRSPPPLPLADGAPKLQAALRGVARAAAALMAAYERELPTADEARWARARDGGAFDAAEQALVGLEDRLRLERSQLRALDWAETEKRLTSLSAVIFSVMPSVKLNPRYAIRARERREARAAGGTRAPSVKLPPREINRMR